VALTEAAPRPRDAIGGALVGALAVFAAKRRSLLLLLLGTAFAGLAAAGALGWLMLSSALSIESDPPNASLYINDAPAGRTGAVLMGWSWLTWHVRVEAPGYLPWSATPQLEPRGTTRLFARLAPVPGRLEVDSTPPGAIVTVDGQEAGPTPLAFDALSPGYHRIGINLPDYERWDGGVEILADRTAKQHITLAPLPAQLVVLSAGGEAALWIDDSPRGFAPTQVLVEPGEHFVRLESDGYRSWERRLTLRPNETRTVNLALQQPWPDPAKAPLHVLAVMVENQEQARPQAGLDHASVVYEALAEGGITRFLALYATADPEVVGPVRSARHYYVNWAMEYGAPLLHVGSSPLGYAAISTSKLPVLDDMRGDPGFWRAPDRPAPHNLYIHPGHARDILKERRATPDGSFGGLSFKRAAAAHIGEPVTYARIKFGSWSYTTEWHYDPYWNEYTRSMEAAPHIDAVSGEQLRATNVLIQSVESWLIEHDREGRLEFAQVGTGGLTALVDGVAISGTWSKSSLNAPTEYRDGKGQPLRLNAGPTWIVVVPPEGEVVLHAD
jgi:hypothetical protein